MKKNNVKVMILTAVAMLGLLTGCNKNESKNEDTTPQVLTWYDTLPSNDNEYYDCNYDAKILQTVPVLNKEVNEVIGWVWEKDYCHVMGSNGTYDYVMNIDGICGYVEHQYLSQMTSVYCNQFAFLNSDTETYTGPASRLYPKTGDIIEVNQKVLIIDEYDYFSYCRDEHGNYSYIPNACLVKLPNTYIETDISDQKSYLYVDGELLLEFNVTTGTDETPTPEGYYQVTVKQRNKELKDGAKVDYWVAFIGDLFGYHDASWRSYYDFGSNIYHTGGSHGCINSPYDAIQTVYDNVEVGTKVLIHK